MVDEAKEKKNKMAGEEPEIPEVPNNQEKQESVTAEGVEPTTDAEDKLAEALEGEEPSSVEVLVPKVPEEAVPKKPELPPTPMEKTEPIEPPKEGLAPEVPRPKYSANETKPNLSGIVPGAERPGRDLSVLQEQVKTSPVDDVKKGMKGKGGISDISRQAEKLHNNESEDLDKAA